MFGAGVDHHASTALPLIVAGYVDNGPAAPGLHLIDKLPRDDEVGSDVEVDHPVPGVIVLVSKVLEVVAARIVDDQVRGAMGGFDLLGH